MEDLRLLALRKFGAICDSRIHHCLAPAVCGPIVSSWGRNDTSVL